MHQQLYCKLCSEMITDAERWEYTRLYAVETPEVLKQRVHNRCVTAQVREVLRLMARVPEDERNEIYFDL